MDGFGPEYEQLHRRALRIRESAAPGSAAEARSLQNFAMTVRNNGDARAALELELRALAMLERLDPHNRRVGSILSNMCITEMHRGNFASADDYCGRSLDILRKLGPGGREKLSYALRNTAALAATRGDYERANAALPPGAGPPRSRSCPTATPWGGTCSTSATTR